MRQNFGIFPTVQGPEYMEAARQVARLLHERGDIEAAKNIIEASMQKHPTQVVPEYINLLLELLISLREFPEALKVLCQQCSTKFKGTWPMSSLN